MTKWLPACVLCITALGLVGAIALGQADTSTAGKSTGVLDHLAPIQGNQADVTLPEVMVFLMCRQKELTGALSETTDQQIASARAMVHDDKRCVDQEWISRLEQQRRRTEYEKRLADAKKSLKPTPTYSPSRTPGRPAVGNSNANVGTHLAQAAEDMQGAARIWPDVEIRELLLTDLDLRQKNYTSAERRMKANIQRDPFVAAYHQGRGLALLGLNQPLEALEEFTACLELRDDSALAYELVQQTMETVPGAKVSDPIYLRAQEWMDRYEGPKAPATPAAAKTLGVTSKGVDWLMPGKGWQAKDETLLVPPVDRIVNKQALAIPVAEGTLLTDAAAVAGADLIYVQIAPGLFVRAEPAKAPTPGLATSAPSGQGTLAVIKVKGVTFTPVAADKPALLSPGQNVSMQSVNIYRQMGSEMQTRPATVQADDKGAKLDKMPLPGEAVSVVLTSSGQYAGLMTARANAEDPACSPSTFIPSTLVASLLPQAKKPGGSYTPSYNSYSGSSGLGTLKLKKDAPSLPAKGQVFLVEILIGEKPTSQLLGK